MSASLLGVAGLRAAALIFGTASSILVARELGPASYGQLIIVLAVLSLLSIPSNNAIVPLLIRQVSAYDQNSDWPRLKGLLSWSGKLSFYACLLGSVLILGWVGWLHVSGSTTEASLYLLAAPLLFLWAGAARISGVLTGLNRVVLAQIFDWLLNPLLYLSLVLFVFWIGRLNTLSVLCSMLLAATVSMVAGLLFLRRHLNFQTRIGPATIENDYWRSAWQNFVLIQALSVLNMRVPVLLLGIFGSDAEAGLYRVADNVSMMLSLTLLVVNTVIGPQVARLYACGDLESLGRLTRNAARGALAATVPVALIVAVFGEELLSFVFGAQYAAAYPAMLVLTIGQLVNLAVGSVGLVLNMTGHEQHAVRMWGLVLLLNLALGTALIPFFGGTGAAVAAATSTILWNLLLLFLTKKLVGISTAIY